MKSSADDLEGFARRLGTFRARAVSLDRDVLVFAAGQASAKPAKANVRPLRTVWVWQASTVAMTLLSVALGSLLMWPPTPATQIVSLEREVPEIKQTATSPSESQIPTRSPQVTVGHPAEAAPLREADDTQLAKAWQARRDLIAASGQTERQLATSARIEGRSASDQPLTRSSLLGDRSQETIQRWLKEQL